jgi:hypothetical protein
MRQGQGSEFPQGAFEDVYGEHRDYKTGFITQTAYDVTKETTPWETTRTAPVSAYPRTAMRLDTTADAAEHLAVSEEPIAQHKIDAEHAVHKDDSKKHSDEHESKKHFETVFGDHLLEGADDVQDREHTPGFFDTAGESFWLHDYEADLAKEVKEIAHQNTDVLPHLAPDEDFHPFTANL